MKNLSSLSSVGSLTRWGLVAACAVAVGRAAESNWPHWRGPSQTGVAAQGQPPSEWSETKNVKWKVAIPGEGSSTPIVWGDRIFVLSAVPTGKKIEAAPASAAEPPATTERAATPPPPPPPPPPAVADGAGGQGRERGPGGPGGPGGRRGGGGGGRGGGFGGPKPSEFLQFTVFCLDRKTGKVLWQRVAVESVPHEGHHRQDGSFAATSPITDGKHLYAYFGSRGLHCYDFDGKRLWSQDFGDMKTANSFGEGGSPALMGNTLVVQWDHEGDSFIVAVDKNTGKTLWRKAREERTSWSTPLVIDQGGKKQVVTTATGKIRSYSLEAGDLLWDCGGLTPNVIPSPVADAAKVYCISGFRGNALLAIRLGRSGDLTDSDAIAWRHNKSTPYVPSPLLVDGKLYFYSHNNGVLSCFDTETGKALIDAERVEGLQNVYASPVAAGGKIYLSGRNGSVVVIKQSDKLEILATNRLEDGFDASPAIAGNELFLRGKQHLYCVAN